MPLENEGKEESGKVSGRFQEFYCSSVTIRVVFVRARLTAL